MASATGSSRSRTSSRSSGSPACRCSSGWSWCPRRTPGRWRCCSCPGSATTSTATSPASSTRPRKLGAILDPVADRLYILATVIGLGLRDIIPLWLAVILPARDLFLWCLVPFLRTRGYSALPVHFLGKAATAALLYAFPLLLLGDGTGTLRRPSPRCSAGPSRSGGSACTGGPGCSTPGRSARCWRRDRRTGPMAAADARRLAGWHRPGRAGRRRERRTPGLADPPPQATMGLLNYVTATSLDEDYAHVSRARAADSRRRPAQSGARAPWRLVVLGALRRCWSPPPPSRRPQRRRAAELARVAGRAGRRAARRARATQRATRRAAANARSPRSRPATSAAHRPGRALPDAARPARRVRPARSRPRGPGVEIVVDDAPNATDRPAAGARQGPADPGQRAVVAGAEAVRSTASAHQPERDPARPAGDHRQLRSLRRPYTVTAIGDPDQLAARFLETEGGRTWWFNLQVRLRPAVRR